MHCISCIVAKQLQATRKVRFESYLAIALSFDRALIGHVVDMRKRQFSSLSPVQTSETMLVANTKRVWLSSYFSRQCECVCVLRCPIAKLTADRRKEKRCRAFLYISFVIRSSSETRADKAAQTLTKVFKRTLRRSYAQTPWPWKPQKCINDLERGIEKRKILKWMSQRQNQSYGYKRFLIHA